MRCQLNADGTPPNSILDECFAGKSGVPLASCGSWRNRKLFAAEVPSCEVRVGERWVAFSSPRTPLGRNRPAADATHERAEQ